MIAATSNQTEARDRALYPADVIDGVRRATSALPKWYADEIAQGMTDDELAAALQRVLGIHGGSGARDCLHIEYQGSGLKIWVSWTLVNNYGQPPTVQGQRTIDMVRVIYTIPDPSDAQGSLL